MRLNISRLLLLFFAMVSAGCAAWSPAGGLYMDTERNFSAELPEAWQMNNSGPLFLTKEGPELQYIFVQTHKIGEPLVFSKKKFYKGMKAVDMAELFLENNSLDPRIGDFKLLGFTSGAILDFPGFKIEGMYRNQDGLRHRFIYYGFMSEKWYYGVSYSAAMRVYFEKDLNTFKEFFSTFKVIPDDNG